MTRETVDAVSSIAPETLRLQFSEDPNREAHEKETAFHVEGDGNHFTISSFKRVVYSRLLQRPEFSVKRLHVLDNGQAGSVESLNQVAADPSLTVIGVDGRLPVGAMSIGTPRNSNSHADLVK